ncbi:MAG: DASS family sodium-coupled anion symporter [Thermoplasmatales archaeon]
MSRKHIPIKAIYLLVVTVISILIALFKPLKGYSDMTNYGLAIFFWAVANWMYQTITPYITGFIALVVALLIGVSYTTVYSGFSNDIFWVIVGSYFLAIAFIKSNIARRLGYYLVSKTSGSLLAAVMASTWTNTIFSPVVMSNTARGGLFAPVTKGMAEAIGSEPGDTKGGKTIFLASTFVNVFNTNWALTALSTNLLALTFFTDVFHVDITWLKWLELGFPMLITVSLVPIVINLMFRRYPLDTPESKAATKQYATESLKKMGPVTTLEKKALILFVIVIALFIADSFTKIDLSFVAILAMVLVVLPPFSIVKPKEALNNVEWGIILWLGTAISIGTIGSSLGVFKALTNLVFVSTHITSLAPVAFIILLIIALMYFHAISPGYVAYTVAIIPITLALIHGLPFSSPLLGFLVIFTMGVGAAFFPFNSAPNLFFYGYNYYSQKDFLKGGLVLSVIAMLNIILLYFLWWPLVRI